MNPLQEIEFELTVGWLLHSVRWHLAATLSWQPAVCRYRCNYWLCCHARLLALACSEADEKTTEKTASHQLTLKHTIIQDQHSIHPFCQMMIMRHHNKTRTLLLI